MIEYEKKMLGKLPLKINEFTIRELNRKDIDIYANWPDYPTPYEMFNTSLKSKPISERDKRWESYCRNNNALSLVVDHREEKMIAKFSLFKIDWKEMCINNIGIRVHPQWCNKGNGARMLKGISNWCFNNGIVKIKFDVLSTNHRAVKCYKNVGYNIISEFKQGNEIFFWMELERKQNA